MSPQIMGPQMNSYHLACFIHNFSPGRIGNRKDPLIGSNPFTGYVFLETVGNFLWNKDHLPFLPALGASEGQFPIFDIPGGQFQDLANPHPTPGHQLKNQPIPGFGGAKDDFIHDFLFQDLPTDGTRGSIKFSKHRGIAWVSEVRVKVLGDKIEEGSELGVPGVFG
jgi:hypothetical protein